MNAPPDPPNLIAVRDKIFQQLAASIDAASARIHAAASGQSPFTDEGDLRAAFAVLCLLPRLLNEVERLEFLAERQRRIESLSAPLPKSTRKK
jgi:hypothetical protein